jgi:hypothetical protein
MKGCFVHWARHGSGEELIGRDYIMGNDYCVGKLIHQWGQPRGTRGVNLFWSGH